LGNLSELHSKLHSLWASLGGPVDPADEQRFSQVDESRLGEDRILSFQAAVREAEAEKKSRLAVARDYAAEIAELRALLAADSTAPEDADLPVTQAALAAQQTKLEWLRSERVTREVQIKDLARRISPLWDLLGITAHERQAFFDAHAGLGTEVIAAVRPMSSAVPWRGGCG
jgi:hypothetical protein